MKLKDFKSMLLSKGEIQITNKNKEVPILLSKNTICITLNQTEIVNFNKVGKRFLHKDIDLFKNYSNWDIDNIYVVNNQLCMDLFN